MENPIFSVVIPAFQAEATVAVAVRSALLQTEPRLEVILVDDGSSDDTVGRAMAAAGEDRRLTVLRQANAGVAAARNAGLRLARGEYIAFLDADDRWVPQALEVHAAAFAMDPGLGLSFGQVRFHDPAMQIGGRLSAPVGRIGLVDILGENPLCTTSNMVFRRRVLEDVGGFDEALSHAEDQELVARVLAVTGWKVQGIAQELVHYRTSVGGLSTDLGRMQRGWTAMMDSLAARAPAAISRARPRATARFGRYLGRRALRTGQGGALGHLLGAFRASPVELLRHDPHRSLLTLLGALGAALLPGRLIRNLVSR
ncbi:glycosyltransferase family 2 protein [Rhodovarius crocodyli]|uniref:Glycosyltransferase family 2 protein n=1 Tax=Rhodovarius crocodyli TaxID=1979269 RepID=A0A437MGI9_9PROT|nr:glycosyltransferase family A protein [Rhodovarius crocodyli]RVT96747.1 glycosyltransferase family 2 protein [Rhodovarius crocodyli]